MRQDKDKITVKYSKTTNLVVGYYPNDIDYQNENFQENENFAFIEITSQNWKDNLHKRMVVIDGNYTEYSPTLNDFINEKLLDLDNYHFNSNEIRILKINNIFDVSLTLENRDLMLEQINLLQLKVSSGMVTEQDAFFRYYYSGENYIDVSFSNLKGLYIAIHDIVGSNYTTYKLHQKNIKALTTIEEVEAYDITANYIKNQNINLI